MSDEFDALKAALRAVPAADPAAKAAAMRLAMENFDRLQGSTEGLRPKQDRPVKAGILQKGLAMLNALKMKPVLAATTSVAALLVGFVVILPLSGKGPMEEARGKQPALQVDAPVDLPVPDALPEPMIEAQTGAARKKEAPKVAEAPAKPATEPSAEDGAQANLAADATQAAPQSEPEVVMQNDQALADAAPAPMPTGRAVAKMAAESYVAGVVAEPMQQPQPNTETFANADANPVKVTAEEPLSTFSIDVDTASYATVRSSLNAGYLPDPASVRIEEMVNYFPYAYPKPEGDQAFRPTITVMPTPWNPNTRLVNIAIQGAVPQVANRPPLNLVFLVDTSGSMEDANKLPLLKQSLALMLGQLKPEDQVAIVAYAGSAGQVLPPTKATDTAVVMGALDQLAAGGSTAGAQGLELAYQTAESMKAEGEISRVLLATDGDFNVGIDDPEALKTFIAKKRESGVYLSVLGFGRGNLDDATMQALAQNGNGTASYIDTLNEARKVLVDQLSGALYPIADNVKIQVEWNPAQVAEYRLIGYETRALAREDFNNDKVDAGDIGAGTAVTAIYEVTAPNSPALRNDPLRYGTAATLEGSDELGYLRLRSVAPGGTDSTLQETPILPGTPVTDETRFAAAIAGFGQLLTDTKYLGDWGWDQAIDLALASRGADEFGYRIEAVNLMRTAKALSQR
ncbi:MAG: von Willebrand factor type A domain-containing protein [Cypionkella sp.]|uniref:vWA domain-containing protein n=1 Tax=Cypionkella sp. TaxID=2811411 RepID=UPI002ABA53CF|nr:von Willebrand factor type A domain-containing protein [Cypionkella sp.]MDZ4310795.1 von Willebrand factor type A domain-containing protein [Cypionkella sp.]